MAKIQLLWPGKTKESWLRQGIEFFLKRLKNYYQVNVVETRPAKYSIQQKRQALEYESKYLVKAIEKSKGYNVILDNNKGKKMSSEGFAHFIKIKQDHGISTFVFVIGGSYGLSDQVLGRADMLLSLSDMTFTHEMARVILMEQLYRAAAINAGSPYHH